MLEKKFFSIKTHKEWIERFRKNHIKFLAEPKIEQSKYFHKRDFFMLLIREMVEDFKENDLYYIAEENFIKVLTRRGKGRIKGERFVSSENLATFQLGQFPKGDNTFELLYNVIFSLAKKENMKNIAQYSVSYFFLDIVEYLEANFHTLVKKYSVK